MVPIHDTDVAEQRWSDAEWETYELWEKVEARLKRKRRLWIVGTIVLFLVLSSVPIVVSRAPKWKTRSIARQLALEINQLKKDASVQRTAFRLSFPSPSSLTFLVHRMNGCGLPEADLVRTGVLTQDVRGADYMILRKQDGSDLGIPGLVQEICYDPLNGSNQDGAQSSAVAFGIIPVKDLTEKRLDRLTVLLLTGLSAEISFD